MLPFFLPGDLPNSRIKPVSPVVLALAGDSLPLSHLGSPRWYLKWSILAFSRVIQFSWIYPKYTCYWACVLFSTVNQVNLILRSAGRTWRVEENFFLPKRYILNNYKVQICEWFWCYGIYNCEYNSRLKSLFYRTFIFDDQLMFLIILFHWKCFLNSQTSLHASMLSHFSRVWLCKPIDCGRPGSSFRAFFRLEYWSGLPCAPPVVFLTQGSNPVSCRSCIASRLFTAEPLGKPQTSLVFISLVFADYCFCLVVFHHVFQCVLIPS